MLRPEDFVEGMRVILSADASPGGFPREGTLHRTQDNRYYIKWHQDYCEYGHGAGGNVFPPYRGWYVSLSEIEIIGPKPKRKSGFGSFIKRIENDLSV